MIYVHMPVFTEAAKHIHESVLSKFKPFEEKKFRLNQMALYLLDDGSLLYASDINNEIDKISGLPKDKQLKERVRKTIYRPDHGLLISMIEAALVPVTLDFYRNVFPGSEMAKALNLMTQDEIARLQLMMLFSEVGFGSKHKFKHAAEEFRHYCAQRKIYLGNLDSDGATFELLDDDKADDTNPKLFLMRKVKQHLESALYSHDKDLSNTFRDLAAGLNPAKLKVLHRYLKYIGAMLQKVGFHQSSFIELDNRDLTQDLTRLLKQETAIFDKRIFNFSTAPEGDVLLAYKALYWIPREDFIVKEMPESKHFTNIELADEVDFADFNPAAAALKNTTL